jgi:ABC-2 type transport system permease protein
MNKTLAVARWEYVEKVKSKAFLISLLLTPAIMVGVGIVPALLAVRADTDSKVIGIVDCTGDFTAPLSVALQEHFRLPNGQPNYVLRPIEPGTNLARARTRGDSLALSGAIEGYLVVDRSVMSDTVIEYRSPNPGNIRITERLIRTLRDLIVDRKLTARGIDPALVKDLTGPIELKTIKLTKTGVEEEAGFEKVFFTSYVFVMMMFFLVVTSGQLLVRSMLEEKSNRVVEVLMSSCSAQNMMAGKILGLSGLGLTQLAFWLLIGVTVSLKFSVTLVPLGSALILFMFAILGYVLYAAIFVAAGAPVSTEQEAQQITGYLVIVLIIPITVAFSVIQDPNSMLAKILSFIPLLTPSMMALRIPIQMPPPLEIVAGALLVALSAAGAIWVAGKIFRTTILLVGKRPGIGELIRIIRSR